MGRGSDFLVIYPFFNIQFSWGKYIIRKCFSHVFPLEEYCMTALFFGCLLLFLLFVCCFWYCFLLYSTGIPIVICKDRGRLMLMLPTVKLMEKVWVVVWVFQVGLQGFFLNICDFLLRSASKFPFGKLFPKSVGFNCPM